MGEQPAAGNGSDRPNIFMIFSDDTSRRDFGCYGNPGVRTPNLDRLASEGMRFNNVFTTSPTCVPSRVSLYTGLYPIRNGAHPNWSSVKPDIKSLPHYMTALGYRVVLLGKKHITPWENFPFEYYEDEDEPLGPGSALQRLLAEPGDRPFCIIMCKFSAHVPWPHNDYGYEPQAEDIPPHLIDTPDTRAMRARYYSKITEMDAAVGRCLALLKAEGLEEDTLVIYTTDHGSDWPDEKWSLHDGGINQPFIARWPGKIEPGSVSEALVSFVDILPTLIETAGGDVDAVVARCGGEPLDGESFLPLLLGEADEHRTEVFANFTWGVMVAYPMRAVRTRTHKYIWNLDSHLRYTWPVDVGWWGESQPPPALTPIASHAAAMWDSWFEAARTDPLAAERVRALQFRPAEELYDIEADPFEMNNLAGDPAQAEVLESLREKVRAWMEQQGDDGGSAYHGEAGRARRFLDEFYGRQVVVNARMYYDTNEAATLELICPVWQAEIRFTLDGSEPTRASTLYSGPFSLSPPATIKAKAFFDGGETPLRVVEFPDIDYLFHYKYHFKPVSW